MVRARIKVSVARVCPCTTLHRCRLRLRVCCDRSTCRLQLLSTQHTTARRRCQRVAPEGSDEAVLPLSSPPRSCCCCRCCCCCALVELSTASPCPYCTVPPQKRARATVPACASSPAEACHRLLAHSPHAAEHSTDRRLAPLSRSRPLLYCTASATLGLPCCFPPPQSTRPAVIDTLTRSGSRTQQKERRAKGEGRPNDATRGGEGPTRTHPSTTHTR